MPVLPDHPISNRRRYDLFGTLPQILNYHFFALLSKNVIFYLPVWPYRLSVRTQAFQAWKQGSTPCRVTKIRKTMRSIDTYIFRPYWESKDGAWRRESGSRKFSAENYL